MWKIVSIETRWYGTSVPDLNLAQWSEFSLIVSVVSAWLYVWSHDQFWAWYHVSSTCTSHSSNFRKKLKNPKIVEKGSSLKLEAIISYGRLFFYLCGWQNVLCHFLPSTIDKTEFDSVQTHVLNENPKNPSKTYHCKSSILPLYRRQTQKAFIFQRKGPNRSSWVQPRQIPRFKKIAGRGHKFWTPLELWNLILNSSRQQF